jgi:hypothetical protein
MLQREESKDEEEEKKHEYFVNAFTLKELRIFLSPNEIYDIKYFFSRFGYMTFIWLYNTMSILHTIFFRL